MKFYVIANGYIGEGYHRVYVSAENDTRALELASEVFKERGGKRNAQDPKYYSVERLSIVYCLSGNTEGVINEVDD